MSVWGLGVMGALDLVHKNAVAVANRVSTDRHNGKAIRNGKRRLNFAAILIWQSCFYLSACLSWWAGGGKDVGAIL